VPFALSACGVGLDLPDPRKIALVIFGLLAMLVASYIVPQTRPIGVSVSYGLTGLSLYAAPLVTRVFPRSPRGAYSKVLVYAVVSGVLMGLWSAFFRVLGATLPSPVFVGLFGFVLFFVINCGYFYVEKELNRIFPGKPFSVWGALWDYDGVPPILQEQARNVRSVALWNHFNYLNFVIGPVLGWLTKFIWPIGPHELSREAVAIVALFVVTIGLGAIVNGSYLSFEVEVIPPETVDTDALYRNTSDLRTVLFWAVIHNFLVASMLAIVLLLSITTWSAIAVVQWTVAAFTVAAVLFGLVPFMMGQRGTVDAIAARQPPYVDSKETQAHLWKLRRPWPGSGPQLPLVLAAALSVAAVLLAMRTH
jgi:xanthosine utilization system XapX-like protein